MAPSRRMRTPKSRAPERLGGDHPLAKPRVTTLVIRRARVPIGRPRRLRLTSGTGDVGPSSITMIKPSLPMPQKGSFLAVLIPVYRYNFLELKLRRAGLHKFDQSLHPAREASAALLGSAHHPPCYFWKPCCWRPCKPSLRSGFLGLP